MAKRFTDTDKYKKPFIRGLKGPYKLLWDYLYHDCDNAGIWIVDFDIAQIYLGSDMPVNKEDAFKYFNQDEERIVELDKGKKWFILPFVKFQYGELNPTNRAHLSVINKLSEYELINDNKPLTRSLQGRKDKDKVKDKDKDKDSKKSFEKFWDLYDHKKSRPKCETKWDNMSKAEREEAIKAVPEYVKSTPEKEYRKHPLTWLNGECWNDEIVQPKKNPKEEYQPVGLEVLYR